MTLRKSLVYSAALVAVFALAGGTALAHTDSKDSTRAFLSPTEATVSIGANGKVLVRGAEVSAVTDDTITATTLWGGHGMTWTVDTTADTDYVDASGDASARSDIEVGDTLSFSGMLDGTLLVIADTVRNWSSPEARDVTFTGKVKSVSSSSLTVDVGNRTLTVAVTSDTDIKVGGDSNADLADIEVGDTVHLAGSYDADDEAVSATSLTVKSHAGDHSGKSWKKFFDLDFWHDWRLKF